MRKDGVRLAASAARHPIVVQFCLQNQRSGGPLTEIAALAEGRILFNRPNSSGKR